MTRINKVIRDKIPEIIRSSGRECTLKSLDDETFLPELEKKLHEEIDEYIDSQDVEELVDIMEVVYRIAQLRGYSKAELERIRMQKQVNKGAFMRNLYLFETSG